MGEFPLQCSLSFANFEDRPMSTSETTSLSETDRERFRDAWLARLGGLIDSVENWVRDAGWSTRRIEKLMHDSEIGKFPAPALLLQEGTTRVLLEPVARSAPGAEGVVDLYLMPAYDDIASLYFCDGRWQLHYMFPGTPAVATIGDTDSKTLSKETLFGVLDEMRKNAAANV